MCQFGTLVQMWQEYALCMISCCSVHICKNWGWERGGMVRERLGEGQGAGGRAEGGGISDWHSVD